MSTQATTTASPGELYWRHSLPCRTDSKMLLLTVGEVAVIGQWYGTVGEHFLAWCPLPKRDKALEVSLGLVHPAQTPSRC